MDRREFLAGAAVTSLVGLALAQDTTGTQPAAGEQSALPPGGKFKLNYAPHFDMFKHHAGNDLIDQLKFITDQGFTGLEDNTLMKRPPEVQEKIGAELARLGMTMGVFVANADFGSHTFVKKDPETRKMLVEKMKAALDTAKRVNAKWCTVVPDAYDPAVDWDYQTANVIDNLRACAEVCEPAGLVMVLEPLNKMNHPGLFLTKVSQTYAICRAVNSPSCKILDDLYHQQITEGNLIPNMDAAWDEIAYFQVGDNPGRKEPTTGEINYKNIFKHIHSKGFTGIVGMEHGNAGKGREGEIALIKAYREVDSF